MFHTTHRRSTIGLITLTTLLLVGCGGTQPAAAPSTAAASASSVPAASASLATSAAPSTASGAETSPVATTATSAATTEATTTAGTTTAGAGTDQNVTPAIVAAANAFLGTLDESQKDTVLFDWTDTAQKQRWSNFPPAGFERVGLTWGDLNETQQTAWLAVLQTTLSNEGYTRFLAEWRADDALLAEEGTGGGFGTANYYIALIGTPSETDPWQLQYGGHHVTLNATIVGEQITLTPSFIGCQPCTYTDANGATVRPLGDIEDEGFALVNSLNATQQQAAVLGSSSIDLVLGPGQGGRTLQAEGLPTAQMNADQQAALLQLISHYTGLVNAAVAATRTAEIEASLPQTYFAWYGPTVQGSVAYFRITGPTIVIEFSPQANGGPGGGSSAATDIHIHGVYRDPTNEYGEQYTGIRIEY